MRRGRRVGILGADMAKDGAKFFRVAVSRNTRGWVLADAVIRPGAAADAERLMRLIEENRGRIHEGATGEALRRRVPCDEFRAEGLMILGKAAEGEAERLSRDAKRRVGDDDPETGPSVRLTKRDFMLNYAGLDRFNRIGVTFDYDATSDRIVYDGAAYRDCYGVIREAPKRRQQAKGWVKEVSWTPM